MTIHNRKGKRKKYFNICALQNVYPIHVVKMDVVAIGILFLIPFIFVLFPPFITQSVPYKPISTTHVVAPKIQRYFVHVLQSNIPMNILQSHDHISVK